MEKLMEHTDPTMSEYLLFAVFFQMLAWYFTIHTCQCDVPECASEMHVWFSAPPVSKADIKYIK